MKFDVLTLFPEMFEPLKHSIIERASKQNLININLINIRDFSKDKHKKVDDTPYGGGAGMVMRADVVYDAYKSVKDEKSKVIFLSPQGKKLNQAKVQELSKEEHLILLCGHYEGVDQRVLDEIVDEEISIGDYVLTGGELPAMVLIDSVSRYALGGYLLILICGTCFLSAKVLTNRKLYGRNGIGVYMDKYIEKIRTECR